MNKKYVIALYRNNKLFGYYQQTDLFGGKSTLIHVKAHNRDKANRYTEEHANTLLEYIARNHPDYVVRKYLEDNSASDELNYVPR